MWRTAPSSSSNVVTKMTIVIKKWFPTTNRTKSRQLQRQTSKDQRPAHSINILIEVPTRRATCRREFAKNWPSVLSALRSTLVLIWSNRYENLKRIRTVKVAICCKTWWPRKTLYSANHQHSWKGATMRLSKSSKKQMGQALYSTNSLQSSNKKVS